MLSMIMYSEQPHSLKMSYFHFSEKMPTDAVGKFLAECKDLSIFLDDVHKKVLINFFVSLIEFYT